MVKERLHKVLAAAGIASRRRAEELIAEGHVSVDGVKVRAMGLLVDPETQEIRFDDELVKLEKPGYYLVWKPKGYLCTTVDEWGRKTVVSLIRDRQKRRLYTVGRLEEESEGLILVTNDGEFANLVAHPRHGVEKTYRLKLHGFLDNEDADRVRKGIWLSDGRSAALVLRIEKRSKNFTEVSVTVREGMSRELRRVFAKTGHAVDRMVRVRIGPISTQGLKRGEVRVLRPAEVQALLDEVSRNRAAGPRKPRSSAPAASGSTPAAKGDGKAGKIERQPGKGRPGGRPKVSGNTGRRPPGRSRPDSRRG